MPGGTELAESALWLVDSWAQSLAASFQSMGGESLSIHVQPGADASRVAQDSLCWQQTLSLLSEPSAWAELPETTWREMGVHALKAVGINQPPDSEIKDTCREIVSQAFSGMARALSARIGTEVSCTGTSQVEEIPVDTLCYQILLGLGGNALPSILLGLSPALVTAIRETPKECKPELSSDSSTAAVSHPETLDVLLDVELPVSVSFGRTIMPLQDVLKLAAGSVIELDRTVNDPVELVINNCVVALGQVVVVEGNYGIKIEKIASRETRLRTSGGRQGLS